MSESQAYFFLDTHLMTIFNIINYYLLQVNLL